jgi:hypothetical protein
VNLGDCGSSGDLHVCSGYCSTGRTSRIIAKAGAYAATEVEHSFGGTFGVEVIPPWLGGHLSLQGEWWTENLWRFGPGVLWPVHDALLIGATADAAHTAGNWGVGIGGRAEFFPWILFRGLIPLQYVSLSLDFGGILFDTEADVLPAYLSVSLRVWI